MRSTQRTRETRVRPELSSQTAPRRRMMLLITARSYRGESFVRAAETAGVEVIPVIAMSHQLADYWGVPLGVDYGRPEEAVQAMVAYARTSPVDAVLAVDDSGALLAAQASMRLGLPHNSPDSALAARDKHRMRRLMHAASVPCPGFRRVLLNEDPAAVAEEATYPCVVKPINLNGSRGVMRADDPAQFQRCVERLSRMLASACSDTVSDAFLVEDFVPGVEVALEGLLHDGMLHVLALFDKPDPLDGPFFEETIYVTPSRLPVEVQTSIAACAADAARAVGLRTGPVHAELRVNERGPWMLEIAGRSIGGLCSNTLRFDMGMTLEELIVRQTCGLPLPDLTRTGAASGVMMIPIPEAGLLKRVDGVEDALTVPGVDDVEITARLNYPIVPLPEGDSYLGFIFASGDSPAAVEESLRTAHSRLGFHIVPELSLMS